MAHTFFKFVLSSCLCLSHRRGTWPTPELVSGDVTGGHGCRRRNEMQTADVASPLYFPQLDLLSQTVSVAILKAFVARSCNQLCTRTQSTRVPKFSSSLEIIVALIFSQKITLFEKHLFLIKHLNSAWALCPSLLLSSLYSLVKLVSSVLFFWPATFGKLLLFSSKHLRNLSPPPPSSKLRKSLDGQGFIVFLKV